MEDLLMIDHLKDFIMGYFHTKSVSNSVIMKATLIIVFEISLLFPTIDS